MRRRSLSTPHYPNHLPHCCVERARERLAIISKPVGWYLPGAWYMARWHVCTMQLCIYSMRKKRCWHLSMAASSASRDLTWISWPVICASTSASKDRTLSSSSRAPSAFLLENTTLSLDAGNQDAHIRRSSDAETCVTLSLYLYSNTRKPRASKLSFSTIFLLQQGEATAFRIAVYIAQLLSFVL